MSSGAPGTSRTANEDTGHDAAVDLRRGPIEQHVEVHWALSASFRADSTATQA